LTGPPALSTSVDARGDLGVRLSWDVDFLALSLLLVVAGLALHRRGAAALEVARASTTTASAGPS
jgi:hypothetical protein